MKKSTIGTSILALLLLAPITPAIAGVTASFRYALSNFEGPVRSQWAKLAVDHERNEIYALRQRKNDIGIFDEHGMQVFVFGNGLATAADLSIGDDGDIFVLTTGYQSSEIHLLDYRGQPVAEIPLQDVPQEYAEFVADRIEYRRGWLYLVDSDALRVLKVDEHGRFEEGYDFNGPLKRFLPRQEAVRQLSTIDWKRKRLEYIGINGFSVDDDGNMFFTVPVLFKAFKFSPDGELQGFGKAGSGKGKFGVTAGIVTDESGYIYIADRLRSVILVFDGAMNFQNEFGYRSSAASGLFVPDDLAVDENGNIYVGQAANRGVSVFQIVREDVTSSAEEEAAGPARTRVTEPRRTAARAASQRRVVEEQTSVPEEFGVDRGGDLTESEEGSDWMMEEFDSKHTRGE